MANPSTLVNIRDLIKAEADIKGDPNFTNVLLTRHINDAHRDIQLKIFHLGYTEFKSSDALTLSAGTLADKNVKTALMLHDGHGVKYWSCDWTYYIGDDLFVDGRPPILLAPGEKEYNRVVMEF